MCVCVGGGGVFADHTDLKLKLIKCVKMTVLPVQQLNERQYINRAREIVIVSS